MYALRIGLVTLVAPGGAIFSLPDFRFDLATNNTISTIATIINNVTNNTAPTAAPITIAEPPSFSVELVGMTEVVLVIDSLVDSVTTDDVFLILEVNVCDVVES